MNTNQITLGWNGNPWTAPTSSRTEPPYRYLVAAFASFVILVLGLSTGF
jgi:hypothetical protein